MMRSPVEAVDDMPFAPEEPLPVNPVLRHLTEPDFSPATLTQFRLACGQSTAYLVRISSSESGARPQPVLWDRPSLIIGKGEDCDVHLPHGEVSRQHAYFQIIDGRIYCTDLGSRTGTHWSNGAAQKGWVDPDEPVSVGPFSLTFELAPHQFDAQQPEDEFFSDDMTHETAGAEFSEGCEYFLDFLNAGQTVRPYRVTRDVTLIGSGDAAKVHLTHPSVSKSHCSIVRTRTGLWLVDLLSDDGTIVNGHVDSLAPLRSGDEFQVGRFLVAVRYETPDNTPKSSMPFKLDVPQSAPDAIPAAHETAVAEPFDDERSPHSNLSTLNQLAHLTSGPPAENGLSGRVDGISEQFVLNIIKELGIMQQQALQHAQDSMKANVTQLAATFQSRIDTLEQQHTALRDQLLGLSVDPTMATGQHVGLPGPAEGIMPPQLPWTGPDLADPEFSHLPEPDQGAYECSDPDQREAWLRERMQTVEAELDKTRRGWGKKLIEMLGY